MATELFDPASIDAAVNDAFGVKPPKQPPPKQQPAPLRTNNPGALMPGGKMAQYGSMEEGLQALDRNLQSYGKQGINTLAGVINKWSPGNAPGNTPQATQNYINHVAKVTGLKPDQPIDLSNPLVRLQLTAGITQFESGPGAIYGTPPRQAQTAKPPSLPPSMQSPPRAEANIPRLEVSGVSDESMAAMRAAEKTPSQLTVEDLMKPEAIDAAVAEAFNTPPPPTTFEKIASAVGEKVRSLLRSSAALADTLYSPVPGLAGMVTYAGARAAGETEEQAAARQASVVGTLEKPVGKAAGVTETPEYKGEASQRLMEFIGENVAKGADWISEKTGIPKGDVEYYLELGMTAAPFSRTGQRVGQAVGTEAGYAAEAALTGARAVTPQVIQRPIARAAEAVAPGTTRPPAATRLGQLTPEDSIRAQLGYGPADQTVPNVVSNTRGSVGAMGVPDTTIINQALQNASPQLRQAVSNIPVDKANTPAIMRMIEADSLYVPMQLTEGMATGSLKYLSEEKNLRAKYPEIANRIQELNQQLIDNFAATRERTAPDVYSTSKMEASQGIIDAYKALDAQKDAAINGAFTKLRDAAGGNLPIDAPTLLKNIDATLSKELLLTDGRAISQYRELRNKAKSGEMTFDEYLAMRRNLSRLSAEAKDGNTRQAARLMVQELDKLPLTQEVANLKPLADEARNLARQRFDALKKDPAYKAAVNDTVPADKYLDKFVIGGVNKNINTMIDTFGRDSPAHQHMKAGTLYWLKDQARIVNDRGNFSEAGFKKGLKKLDDVKNFQTIFDPETQLQLRTMDNVAHYVKFQPEGHWINNSNTWTNLKAYGAKGLEGLGNLAGLKAFGGIPVGTIVRQKAVEAAEKKRVKKALQLGAGATLEEVSRQGARPSQPSTRRGEPTSSNEPLPPGGGRREPTLD